MTLPWLLLLILLPLGAFGLAVFWHGKSFSTRDVPSDLYRMGTGAAFAAWVDPGLGVLAAVSMIWWWLKGWPRISGGLLWPFVAMGLYLGLQAPDWAIHIYVTGLLCMGVGQVLIGVAQYFGYNIFLNGTNIHGTFGHRTGLGIYLALLVPLAFLTDYGYALASIYTVGILLSRSSVATVAGSAGALWVIPHAWPYAIPVIIGAMCYRMVKLDSTQSWGWKFRHLNDSVAARKRIWEVTLHKSLESWRQILYGAGHGAFQQRARTWIASQNIMTGEVYNEAHNDYLEAFYEYGVVIVLVAGWWVYRYGSAFALSDPLTGSILALGAASLANFPTRVATIATVALMVVVLLMRRVM